MIAWRAPELRSRTHTQDVRGKLYRVAGCSILYQSNHALSQNWPIGLRCASLVSVTSFTTPEEAPTRHTNHTNLPVVHRHHENVLSRAPTYIYLSRRLNMQWITSPSFKRSSTTREKTISLLTNWLESDGPLHRILPEHACTMISRVLPWQANPKSSHKITQNMSRTASDVWFQAA